MCRLLARDVGPVSQITMLYDGDGVSKGVAEVTMDNRDHAFTVLRDLNGAALDDLPMHIVLLEDKPKAKPQSRPKVRRVAPQPSEPQPEPEEEEPQPPTKRVKKMRVVSKKGFVPTENFVIEADTGGSKRNGNKLRGRGRRGGRGRGRGRGRGGARGGAAAGKKTKTQEELNAELEAFMNKED